MERFIFALSSQSWPIISTVPKPPVTSYSSCRRAVTVSGLPTMAISSMKYSRVRSASDMSGSRFGRSSMLAIPSMPRR